MPDNIPAAAPVAAPAAAAPAALPDELKQQMAIALNGGLIPEENQNTPQDTPAAAVIVADPFEPFKTKFGYQTAEDAFKEIEELRGLRANPPAPTLEFEDEDSEKLFHAWQKGKKEEVYSYLEKANRIENYLTKEVNEGTAGDIVKLGMQLKYKDLTPAEIDYKFNKQFALPSKPKQTEGEDEPEFKERLTTWEAAVADKKMELLIEAKLARPEIEGAKSKLVLPEIDSAPDESYLQWKKTMEENDKLAAEASKAYSAFKPEMFETKLAFNDEANKVSFEYLYKPDPESFAKAVQMTSDINLFWAAFYNQDGSPNRQKFLDFVYSGLTKDKMLTEAMNQAKNATIKSMLPDNSQGGLVRQLPSSAEPSEMDKEMALRGIKRG